MLAALWVTIVEILFFWQPRILAWLRGRKSIDVWQASLRRAKTYEEWEEAAFQVDALCGNDLWRQNPASKCYDYRLIHERLQSIIVAREQGDIINLVNLLRSGLVRNLGNVNAQRLFDRAFAGTKLLIEDYIAQVVQAVTEVTNMPTTPGLDAGLAICLTNQTKLDLLHDARQAFGRSTLVLQGGAIFGLCHIGVVKALFDRGLLPRIITGTATGALIAALVGVHTDDELPRFLSGASIDLSAFGDRSRDGDHGQTTSTSISSWLSTLWRRLRRFFREGYLLDVGVLEACVRTNIGDLTFEEAYTRTKRVLNITVATSGRGGVPNLLNYLTAPNVVIWSAAVASNVSSPALYGRKVIIRCKNADGNIIPWSTANGIIFQPWTHASHTDRGSPLSRVAELFNVNHFIVSQARPYLVPFLQRDTHHLSAGHKHRGGTSVSGGLLRLLGMEMHHRLQQLDSLQLLPMSIRRFLVDQHVPAASLTLVPHINASDFFGLLEVPTPQTLDRWILRGQRSVWPAVCALKVRCAIETELDRGYQLVRRRKGGNLKSRSRRGDEVDYAEPETYLSKHMEGAKHG